MRVRRAPATLGSTLVALGTVLVVPRVTAQSTPPATSAAATPLAISAGAYTASQAARGEKVYRASCNSCHAASAYTGESFAQLWVGRSAYDMVTLLRRTMPNDDPGRLPKQQYVDVVAYLFRLNGYPSGARALPTDDAALKRVRIDSRPTRRK